MVSQAEFYRQLVLVLAAAVMTATAAFSEETGDPALPTTTGPAGFEALSPGNRKIAQSLFDVQTAGDGGGSWTLDGIAQAKRDGAGWGNIFKQLKEEGLIAETNLGQVVSGKGMTDAGFGGADKAQDFALPSSIANALPARLLRPRRSNLVVTTANGRRVVIGLRKPGLRSRLKYGLFAKTPKAGRAARGSIRQARGTARRSFSAVSASRAASRTFSVTAAARNNNRGYSGGGTKKAAKIK